LNFNQIKSLEEILRQKESLIRNKNNNISNPLIYSGLIPQSNRTISNNIPEKYLSNNNPQFNSNHKISDFINKDMNNRSKNNMNKNNKLTNFKSIYSETPNTKIADAKFKIKMDNINFNLNTNSEANINKTKKFSDKSNRDTSLQKYLNDNNNNLPKYDESINISNNICNGKRNATENVNYEIENSSYEKNDNIYDSLSPEDDKITSNFFNNANNEKLKVMENLGTSHFLNNINININNLNNPENLKIKTKRTMIENIINVKKCPQDKTNIKKKSIDMNDILDLSKNFHSDYDESKTSNYQTPLNCFDNNLESINKMNGSKFSKNENSEEENELNEKITEEYKINKNNNKIKNINFFSPKEKETNKNFLNYANYKLNKILSNKNSSIKNITNKNKIKTNSLILQEDFDKKIQSSIQNNINNKLKKEVNNSLIRNNLNLTHNLSNILEHSFSNIINVNLNLENKNKYLTKTSNRKIDGSLTNMKNIYDKTIFSHINAVRSKTSLNKIYTKKPIINMSSSKLNLAYKKTKSFNHPNLDLNSQNTNEFNRTSINKKLNINKDQKNICNTRKLSNGENLFLETPRNKSKNFKLLNNLSPDKNFLSNREDLNTSKTQLHRTTKSHHNLDLFKSEKHKKLSKKNVNNLPKNDNQKKPNKSSSKITGKNIKIDNILKPITIRESSLEIKTNISVDDLDLDLKYSNNNEKNKTKNMTDCFEDKSTNINDKSYRTLQTSKKYINKINRQSFNEKNGILFDLNIVLLIIKTYFLK